MDFSNHSTTKDENNNMYEQNVFTDKSETNENHTSGTSGVVVASYLEKVTSTTYTVTIDKVTYYIGEMSKVTFDGTEYYVHKTYDSVSNKFTHRLYTDADCTNEITKIGDNTIKFSKTSTGVTVTCNGETKTPTDLTYKLYKFSDLREEVKTIGNSAVFVPSVDKVIVGTGTNAKNNSSISKQTIHTFIRLVMIIKNITLATLSLEQKI